MPTQVREVAGIVRISPAVYSTPDAAVVFFGCRRYHRSSSRACPDLRTVNCWVYMQHLAVGLSKSPPAIVCSHSRSRNRAVNTH